MNKSSAIGNNVFVFGSNRAGFHSLGAALHARKYCGAIYGQAEGRQGNSYAIITKELRRNYPPVTLEEVKQGVERFLDYAVDNQDVTFIVTPIGTGLAGFSHSQIAPLFEGAPLNCALPEVWNKYYD
jgi:hypothetical protein